MSLVFHESFDSTRATADAPADHANLAQAQIEAVISLLLGRSLSVNHTYSFDSRSFLELAEVVLDTRAEALASAGPGGARRLADTRPFVLYRFGTATFFDACATQLRKFRDPGGGGFRLSAWSPVDQDRAARQELADALILAERDDLAGGPGTPGWLTRDHPALARQWQTLGRLRDYYRSPGRDEEATFTTIGLPDYLGHLVDLPDGTLFELAAGRCPEETVRLLRAAVGQRLADVRNREDTVDDRREAFFSRGWAHDAVTAAATADSPDLLVRQQVQELVDTAYNAVLADSGQARFGYLSSVPRADGRDELKAVNAFALSLIRHRRFGQVDRAGHTGPVMSGVFGAAEVLPNLPVQPMRQVFRAYWQLVADDDRWTGWQDSCQRLDRLLGAVPADGHRVHPALREAWSAHLSTLKAALPYPVSTEDDRLAVGADHAERGYGQTHQLAAVSEEAFDESWAAGEYLDDLDRALAG